MNMKKVKIQKLCDYTELGWKEWGKRRKRKRGVYLKFQGKLIFLWEGGGQEKTKEYLWSIKSGM